jgi:hypothetical protein
MKLTSGLVFKVLLALVPALISGFVTYWVAKDKTADGYTTLAESVNKLQGSVEIIARQVQHLQDLHFESHPGVPASAPATPPACGAETLADLVASAEQTTSASEKAPTRPLRLKLKNFKRVPTRLDDAKK